MRIVFDVNIWISFGIGKRLERLSEVLLHPQVELYASHALYSELQEVSQRPRLKKYLKPARFKEIFDLLGRFAHYVESPPSGTANFVDEKDNYLLDLAESVKADYLVTGDKRLLELRQHGACRVISFSELLPLLELE